MNIRNASLHGFVMPVQGRIFFIEVCKSIYYIEINSANQIQL